MIDDYYYDGDDIDQCIVINEMIVIFIIKVTYLTCHKPSFKYTFNSCLCFL